MGVWLHLCSDLALSWTADLDVWLGLLNALLLAVWDGGAIGLLASWLDGTAKLVTFSLFKEDLEDWFLFIPELRSARVILALSGLA